MWIAWVISMLPWVAVAVWYILSDEKKLKTKKFARKIAKKFNK